MKFTWAKFDPAFLKTVLLASEEFADMHEDIKEEDDIIGLVARMNIICSYPDKKFIMKYRNIIEQDLLKFYPEEVRKICKSVGITGASFNIKQANMTKKPLSAALIGAYIAALLNISGMDIALNEYSRFRYTVALNMAETQTEEVPLYDF